MNAIGNILIVDDDPVIRRLMALSLQEYGCEVAWVDSGDKVLSEALNQPPDLMLLDVMLPDADGIEVCRWVRAEPRLAEVPVIMITALNDPEARLRSLEAGADDFISKPVDFIELRARVGSILRLNRYRRLLEERTQRQRAEAAILRRNRELSLLHEQLQRHVNNLEDIVATRTNELAAERDRTRAILEALGEAVIVTDAEGIIRYANPATTTLTGYSNNDLIGRSWSDIQGNRNNVALYQMIRDHASSGQTWRGEVSSTRRDGTIYDAAMTVAPIFEPQFGGTMILVSVQRDITPLKAAERMKDDFISNVSHELRTPLSIIALHTGNLDTLYDRLADDRRRQLIREVRAQAELLDELIGDVLELSRIDSGQLIVDHQSFDLTELLWREAEQLRPLAQRKGLELHVLAAEPLFVQGYDTHLRQCIRNLLSNAIKFTAPGGTICGECQQMVEGPVDPNQWPGFIDIDVGKWVGLRVVDTGIGIGSEHLPLLFDRFYRVQNQSRVPGTGLGLAITREIITRHGGWTGVASTLGVGSTFVFYLPLADEEQYLAE